MTSIKKFGAAAILALAFLALAPAEAFATHFRYGTIDVRPVPGSANQVVISWEFAYRASFTWSTPYPPVGSFVTQPGISHTGYFITLRDRNGLLIGNEIPIVLQVTVLNAAQDWFLGTGQATVTLPVMANGPWTASHENCCRLSTLQDNNRDASYRVATTFNAVTVNSQLVVNASPVMGDLPFKIVGLNRTTTFQLVATDPDGDPVTFRLATGPESLLVQPTPLPAGSLTLTAGGLVSFSPPTGVCSPTALDPCLWPLQVIATDARGSSTALDFLLWGIQQTGTAPALRLNGSTTPLSFTIPPGFPLSVVLSATDPDPRMGSTTLATPITLSSGSLPIGSSVTPSLPVTLTPDPPTIGQPATATFSWTPSLGDLGSRTLTFTADDDQGIQTTNSLSITISAAAGLYQTGILRDFTSGVDPDFNRADGDNAPLQLVSDVLGADGKPVFAPNGTATTVQSAASFNTWWNKPGGQAFTIALTNAGNPDPNVFTLNSASVFAGHTFFTYELHTYYTYVPGQQLPFSSSDDMWVFINGKLAVDLGGIHALPRSTTLNTDAFAVVNGLLPGGTYRMDIFYAHRSNHAATFAIAANQPAICDPLGPPVATALPTLRGTAATVAGGATRLIAATQAANSGAAWAAALVPIVGGFEAEFDFAITKNAGEGFAFVLQSEGSSARGGSGSNLGHAGITRSLAIEFDVRLSPEHGDPIAGDHISAHTAGALANSASETFSPGSSTTLPDPSVGAPFDFNDGVLHHARIKYWIPDDQSSPTRVSWLDVYVDNAVAPALRVQLDPAALASTFGASSVFAGFTASNGTTLLADVTVSNFKLRVPQLAPGQSNLVALPAAQLPGVEGSVVLQARSACNAKMLIGGDAAAIQATLTSPPYSTPVTITDQLDGTYRLSYTPRVGGNWFLSVRINGQMVAPAAANPFAFLVMPAQPTVSATGGTYPYTGSPRQAAGTAKGVFDEDLGPLTFTYNGLPAAIDGGTYAVVGSFAGSLRYAAATADGTLIITPVQPTVSVTGGTLTYNGLPRHATGAATGVLGEDLGPLTFSYSPGGSAPTRTGTYQATGSYAGNSNYTPHSATAPLTIAPATPTVHVVNATAIYDATPHGTTATVEGVNGEDLGAAVMLTYNGSTVPPVNAGTHKVVGTFAASGDYTAATGAGTVTIDKATPEVEVHSESLVYDAQPHGVGGTVKGVGGVPIGSPDSFTYDGSAALPVNAHVYAVVATFNGAPNYRSAVGNGTLTIGQARPAVVVNDDQVTYDGAAHSATGSVAGIHDAVLGPLTFTYDGDPAEPIDAGSYSVVGTYAGSQNYTSVSDTGTLTIGPATPAVLVHSTTHPYDGQPHVATGTATGVNGASIGTLTFTYNGIASAPADVGVYNVVGSFAGGGNYGPASGNGTLTITAIAPTVTVVDASHEFDGQPHSATGSVIGVGGEILGPLTFAYDGLADLPVNAGSYHVVATFSGIGNYAAATGEGTLAITRATPTVTVTGGSFVYTGQPHTSVGDVKGVGGVSIGVPSITYGGSVASPRDAASYAVLGTFDGNENYGPATGTNTLVITPAAPALAVTGGTFTYDASPHAATGSATGVNGEDLGQLTFTYNGLPAPPINAGSYTVVGSIAAGGNYAAGSAGGVSIVIERAASHVTWGAPGAIVYGTPLSGAQLNATAGVAGTFAYRPAAGVVLDAGPRALTVTFTPADTANYLGASGSVLLTVDRAPLTITADDKTMSAGSAVPALTASYSGFVNGDGAAGLDTPVSLTTIATPASPAGSYPIVASGAADANYTIGFVNGTLTVGPATSLRILLMQVRQRLAALLATGNKHTDKRIDDAMKKIDDSLDPRNWDDELHLSKKGQPAFQHLSQAVSALTAIDGPPAAVTQAVTGLVAISRQLAVLAIEQAAAEGQRARDRERAQGALAQGDGARDLGNWDRAINEYGKAWHQAR